MPYYEPLIKAKKLGRHLFWTNYPLNEQRFEKKTTHNSKRIEVKEQLEVDLSNYNITHRHDQIYRNCVASDIGKFCLDMAFNTKQEIITQFTNKAMSKV